MGKKRLVNILVFLVLLLFPFIVNAETYTITVNGSNPNHTYQAYQIFGGTVSGGRISDVTWGTGVNTTTLFAEHPEYTNPETVAGTLATEADARAFANLIIGYLNLAPTASCQIVGNTCSMGNLAGGYYLIKDVDHSLDNSDEVYTPYILQVIENKTVRPKLSNTPYLMYEVLDSDDLGTDSIAVGYNQDVTFNATISMPADYTSYEHYGLVLTSEVAQGLTPNNNSIKVYVGDQQITNGFTTGINGQIITVTFADLKTITSVTNSSEIKIEYSAKVNTNIAPGSDGNLNTAYITYTNNANEPTQLTGKSETLETYLYTGKIVVHNVDEDGESIEGSTFSLIGPDGTIVGVVDEDDASYINLVGVGPGTYTLRQTATPDSYEPIEDVTLVITVNNYTGEITITSHTGNQITIYTEDDYTLLEIYNKYSALLAFTGGRGTLIYTVTGLGVMGFAVLLILIRKRKDDLED